MQLKVIEGEFAYFANELQLLEKVEEINIILLLLIFYSTRISFQLQHNIITKQVL